MKFKYILLTILVLARYVQARDLFTINFIKSFIENEKKPTDLICNNLGWDKTVYKNLAKELSYSSVKISTFYKTSTAADVRVLFLIDLETADLDVLQKVTRHFRTPFRWLVLSDRRDEARNKVVWGLPLLLDAEFVLAERNGSSFIMIELYKPSPNGPTYSQPRGHYNGTFFDSRPSRQLYRRRGDVMGHRMVMSNVVVESNTTIHHLPREDRLKLEYDTVMKMAWAYIRLTFEMINATAGYMFNVRFGYKSNGSWSGMINDLMTEKAIIGTNLLMNIDRMDVVSYIDTTSPFDLRFLFRQPPLADVSNIFTLPFSARVWIAVIVCAIISSVSLYLNSRLEISTQEEKSLEGKVSDAMLTTLSAISNQGSSIAPSFISELGSVLPGRIILWIIFLSMMLIYSAYSANIVALLQVPSDTIKTFDQLFNSKINLGAEDLDYNHFIFRGNKKLHERIMPPQGKKHLFDVEESARKIRKERYAIHCFMNSMYRRIEKTFLESEKCGLTDIDYLNPLKPGTPLTKDTPYLELFKVSIKRLREVGIYSALYRRYNIPKPRCNGNASSFSSIGLQNMRPVLMLLCLGVAASMMTLLLEIIVHRASMRLNHRRLVVTE